MRQRVETTVDRRRDVVFDFVARDHWQNHPRWDPNVIAIEPSEPGPIHAGSQALVRRKRSSEDGLLEVLEYEPGSRWVSRNEIGPFSLQMTVLLEPATETATRLILIADTRARRTIRYLLPLLAPVFRRQMRASARRIKEMVEAETAQR